VDPAQAPELHRMNEPYSRFTLDGGDQLESQIRDLCMRAAKEVQQVVPQAKVEAMLLGGGYGRGEGGVFRTAEGEIPYNDLEFYICLKGSEFLNKARFAKALHEAGARLSQQAGIDIEFQLLSMEKLRRSPVTMFYYDLVAGHKWIIGDEPLLDGCKHHLATHRIPLHEATRLLMNRCSGLLFAMERLQRAEFTAEDSDFVFRNIAKAKLALGDVILVVNGQYHWSCRERHKRLSKLEAEKGLRCLAEILTAHREGVEFKLHPHKSAASREELLVAHTNVSLLCKQTWLWLESIRLQKSFKHPKEYSLTKLNLCPETRPLKSILLNVKTFVPGVRGSISRYPRERLLRTFPLLLWEKDSRALLPHIQRQLVTSSERVPELVSAYQRIWTQYN
jgi:hypothetical protein